MLHCFFSALYTYTGYNNLHHVIVSIRVSGDGFVTIKLALSMVVASRTSFFTCTTMQNVKEDDICVSSSIFASRSHVTRSRASTTDEAGEVRSKYLEFHKIFGYFTSLLLIKYHKSFSTCFLHIHFVHIEPPRRIELRTFTLRM